jgi:hypothetical protein
MIIQTTFFKYLSIYNSALLYEVRQKYNNLKIQLLKIILLSFILDLIFQSNRLNSIMDSAY